MSDRALVRCVRRSHRRGRARSHDRRANPHRGEPRRIHTASRPAARGQRARCERSCDAGQIQPSQATKVSAPRHWVSTRSVDSEYGEGRPGVDLLTRRARQELPAAMMIDIPLRFAAATRTPLSTIASATAAPLRSPADSRMPGKLRAEDRTDRASHHRDPARHPAPAVTDPEVRAQSAHDSDLLQPASFTCSTGVDRRSVCSLAPCHCEGLSHEQPDPGSPRLVQRWGELPNREPARDAYLCALVIRRCRAALCVASLHVAAMWVGAVTAGGLRCGGWLSS